MKSLVSWDEKNPFQISVDTTNSIFNRNLEVIKQHSESVMILMTLP